MEITSTNVELTILTAKSGHKLYRKDDDLSSAYFVDRVYLGVGDSADNYAEISDEEIDKIFSEQVDSEQANVEP